MQKKYTVKELASILGCSVTAVNKKIKADENNPDIKRYRNRYETVVENNVTYILLDDEALEDEKNKSKGFKNGFGNVSNVGLNESETSDIIDVTPEIKQESSDKILEFTERYIERFSTLQETFYNEMKAKDKQIYLLTTSETQKQEKYFETEAQNKQLKAQNNVLKIVLAVVITLFVTLVITFSILGISKSESTQPTTEKTPAVQQVSQPIKGTNKQITQSNHK